MGEKKGDGEEKREGVGRDDTGREGEGWKRKGEGRRRG